MKKIIFLFCILFSLGASAQTDTTKLRSGKLTLRVNDIEYISTFIAYSETFENLYDSLKTRLRFGNYPSGTSTITIDSVSNGELVALSTILRRDINDATQSAYSRIHTAIRAMNNSTHWVNRSLDDLDLLETSAFTNRRAEGKRRLRKQ